MVMEHQLRDFYLLVTGSRQRPEEGVRAPGTGIIDDNELPCECCRVEPWYMKNCLEGVVI